MNAHHLTLGQAAKQVACSKATVSKALKSGDLSGNRQADGSFRIEPSELIRWDGERSVRNAGSRSQTPVSPPENGRASLDLHVEIARLQERLAAAEADRDRERAERARDSETIEDLRSRLDASETERQADKERLLSGPSSTRRGWLRQLFG